jgi:hypothetical protein
MRLLNYFNEGTWELGLNFTPVRLFELLLNSILKYLTPKNYDSALTCLTKTKQVP